MNTETKTETTTQPTDNQQLAVIEQQVTKLEDAGVIESGNKEVVFPLLRRTTPKGSVSYEIMLKGAQGLPLYPRELKAYFREREGLKGNALKQAVNDVMHNNKVRSKLAASMWIECEHSAGKVLNGIKLNKNKTRSTLVMASLPEAVQGRSEASLIEKLKEQEKEKAVQDARLIASEKRIKEQEKENAIKDSRLEESNRRIKELESLLAKK